MNNRTIAIGDIHGCFYQFKELVENKLQLTNTDTLVLLGDYIDRGTDSKKVIDYILSLQNKDFNLIPLMGNHEKMLLNAFDNTQNLSKWLFFGGKQSMLSFGIKDLSELEKKYKIFFQNLKNYHIIKDTIFVHAGFNDHIKEPLLDIYPMLWTCNDAYLNPFFKNKTVIHGHCAISIDTSLANINKESKVINIDTGCVYQKQNSGLSAYIIETKKLISVT
jgi:serine/threonine protein phosphatase 1